MAFVVGHVIKNNNPNHPNYGDVGKIITINSQTGGATVDWDGDGEADQGAGINLNTASLQSALNSEYTIQNSLWEIEGPADLAIKLVLGIWIIVIGWLYVKRIISL